MTHNHTCEIMCNSDWFKNNYNRKTQVFSKCRDNIKEILSKENCLIPTYFP